MKWFEKLKAWWHRDRRSALDKEIDAVIAQMAATSADSDEYTAMAQNLERLTKLKDVVERNKRPKLNPNQILAVLCSIGGLLLTLGYERLNVITGKAWSMITKTRIDN